MLKSELKRIQNLAKKNAAKAAKEIRAEENGGNEKKREKANVNKAIDASEAHKLFSEMKIREF